MTELTVKISYDEEADVWQTWESEVPGLTVIDRSKNNLLLKIEKYSPELLELGRDADSLKKDIENKYEIIVVEQSPPTYVELEAKRPSSISKLFRVYLPKS